MDEIESFEPPVDGILDLHTFRPSECADLVSDYLSECRKNNILQVRIIHGKGRGVLRDMVLQIVARNRDVVRYGQAPDDAGGWGATVVELRPM